MSSQSKFNDYPHTLPPDADYEKQAIPVPGTGRPGETPIYRSSAFPFVTLQTPGVFTNLVDVFDEGLRRSGGGPFLGHRPILSRKPLTYADYHVWQSWPQIDARRRALGSAVHRLFQSKELVAGDLETVGIWSKNCPNWFVIDLAMQAYNKVSVPLYDTLGADSVEHVINHAELSIVFAASEHVPHLLKLSPKLPTLQMIVIMDEYEDEPRRVVEEWAKTRGISLKTIEQLEDVGKANLIDVIRPSSSAIATICYTSGTSGTPKGVLLSHGNLATTVNGFLHFMTDEPGRTAMSFLPLAHIYERSMHMCSTAVGKQIGYTTNDPFRLMEDIQLLRPHFVALVPRVLNRMYLAMSAAGDAPGLRGALFRRAVEAKVHNLRTTGELTHPLWDRLVFKKIHQALGGRLTKIASGSAPLGQRVAEFLKVCTLADQVDGYAMTENGGCCMTVWPRDARSGGTVGSLVPIAEVKLVDVPELGYRATDRPWPRGEILMRGDSRFVGYYKDEEKTRETIDADGWLRTGDVGAVDDAGRFRIVDRVKNIMKLAQGEYVALEHVENVYQMCPLAAQAFVYGDGLRHCLVGVVVPDPARLAALVAREMGVQVDAADLAALAKCVRDPRVGEAVLRALEEDENVKKLKGFERLKRVHVTFDAFSIDNGCLTPTLKIRRKETAQKYKEYIDAMYASVEGESAKL